MSRRGRSCDRGGGCLRSPLPLVFGGIVWLTQLFAGNALRQPEKKIQLAPGNVLFLLVPLRGRWTISTRMYGNVLPNMLLYRQQYLLFMIYADRPDRKAGKRRNFRIQNGYKCIFYFLSYLVRTPFFFPYDSSIFPLYFRGIYHVDSFPYDSSIFPLYFRGIYHVYRYCCTLIKYSVYKYGFQNQLCELFRADTAKTRDLAWAELRHCPSQATPPSSVAS